MVDGFYTTKFKSHHNVEGAGVLVMRGGKLIGGDNAYKYVGDYAECEGEIRVNVRADRFAPGISVFGDHDSLELSFIATVSETKITFKGSLNGDPEHKLEVVLEKQPEMI
jgi:hypothetical protein